MKTVGNILWLLLTGLVSAIGFVLTGALLCITIIGIPFGMQCFKLAKFVLLPFGKTATTNFGAHPVANILWAVFFGVEFALGYLVEGVLWCITIIGIPFGKQCFKLAPLAFIPFGAEF